MVARTRRTKTEKRARSAVVEGAGQVLQHIRDGEVQTTSDLAAVMGMARSTVLQRLEVLAEQRLVVDQTASSGTRGRPATVWVFNPSAAHILAAHVGLSGCRLAVTDLEGAILSETFFDLDLSAGPDGLLQSLESNFDWLISDAELDPVHLVGIGVGLPRNVELVSYLHSLSLTARHWDHRYFRRVLQTRYDVPVFLDTDVNLLASAERNRTWPDAEVFICVKLGTIIDAAIVIGGVPLQGVAQMAGEIAHLKVNDRSDPCTCGNIGCLDAVASGAALVRQLQSLEVDVHHTAHVVRMANEGTPEAVRAVRTAGRHIGEALAAAVNLLNPSAIVLWGYLTDAETLLLSGIREGLYTNALPKTSEQLTLVSAALGDLAGVLGAAKLAIDNVLDPDELDQSLDGMGTVTCSSVKTASW